MFFKYFSKFISFILIVIIFSFRPLLGPTKICPFTLGCTEYAILQLETMPLLQACYNICKRLLICNPIINVFKKS